MSTQKNDSGNLIGFPDGLSARLWTDGFPPAERAAWLAMTEEKREIAISRARAIDAVLTASASVPDAAASAGLSSARFYSLLREWKRTRSLAVIVPHATGRGRNTIRTPPEAQNLAKELASTHPSLSQEALAKAVVERLPGVVSLSKARRMIARERVLRKREKLGGADGFGRHLLVDRSALDLEVRRVDNVLDYAVFAAVADSATGYVIGFAVGTTEGGGAGLQSEAVAAAIESLSNKRKSKTIGTPLDVQRVVVALDSEGVLERLEETQQIERLGDRFEPESEGGTRAVGLNLNRLLSGRLGNLRLRPGSTFASSKRRLPEESEEGSAGISIQDAQKVIEAAVVGHNRQVTLDDAPDIDSRSIIASLQTLSRVWS